MQTDNLNNPATPEASTTPEPNQPTKTQQPLSPRKLASTRANGALSLGPKTAAGLAKCKAAAAAQIKHGMRAQAVGIDGESEENFRALLKSYIATHQPLTEPEFTAVFQMVAALWRHRRVLTFQTIDFNRLMAIETVNHSTIRPRASVVDGRMPTAAERADEFSSTRVAVIDPLSGAAFPEGIVPSSSRISRHANAFLCLFAQEATASAARLQSREAHSSAALARCLMSL